MMLTASDKTEETEVSWLGKATKPGILKKGAHDMLHLTDKLLAVHTEGPSNKFPVEAENVILAYHPIPNI